MSRRFSLLSSLYQFVRIPITGIYISTNGSTVSSSGRLEKGKTCQLYAIISPSNTTDSKDVRWASGDNSIATVNLTTGLVTAKSNGSCKITVTLPENPDIVAFYTLTVYTSNPAPNPNPNPGPSPDPDPDPDSSTTTSPIPGQSTPSPEDTTTTSSNPPAGTDFSATFKTSDGQTARCEDYGTIVLLSAPTSVTTAYESSGGSYTYNTLAKEYTYVFRDKYGGEHKYFVQIQSYT